MEKPYLAYSELTQKVYIVMSADSKIDVTEQFEKFTLLKSEPTVATDNTLQVTSTAEAEIILKKYYTDAFSEKDTLGFRLINAMNEYADIRTRQEREKTRNEAIQECLDCFKEMFLIPPSDTVRVAEYFKEAYFKMQNLKKS